MVNRLALVVFMAFAHGAAAADRLVPVDDLAEEYLDEPTVAADSVVVGLMLERTGAGDPRSVLAEFPPAERGSRVCLRVRTADGLYTGTGTFSEAAPGSETLASMPYETQHEELFRYPPGDIAVLAYPCPSVSPLRVAVTSWGAAEADVPAANAMLLVNSFRADRAFAVLPGDKIADCVPTAGGEGASFDFRCQIPLSAIRAGGSLTVFLSRGESLDPPVTFDVIGWE